MHNQRHFVHYGYPSNHLQWGLNLVFFLGMGVCAMIEQYSYDLEPVNSRYQVQWCCVVLVLLIQVRAALH